MEERINASMFLNHFLSIQGATLENIDIAPIVIGSWDHKLIKALGEDLKLEPLKFWPRNGEGYTWNNGTTKVTFIAFPVGAPSAVSTLEQLISLGAKVVVGIGFAGSLQPTVPVGSIVIADNCIREEGTSFHYKADPSDSKPSLRLLSLLQEAFEKEKVKTETGSIWTIDAIYRELKSKIQDYGKRGILGVEMETSAMYTVGEFRNIDICNILAISDELWSEWNPQFGSDKLVTAVQTIKNVLLNNLDLIATLINEEEKEEETA